MTARKLRQAVQATIDVELAMVAAVGNKDFYRIAPALNFPEQGLWHSAAGAALYDQKFGDYFILDVTRKELRGFRTAPDLFFWNAWLAAGR